MSCNLIKAAADARERHKADEGEDDDDFSNTLLVYGNRSELRVKGASGGDFAKYSSHASGKDARKSELARRMHL